MIKTIAVLFVIFLVGRALTWLVNPRYKTGETYRQLETETSQAWGPVLNNALMFVFFLVIILPLLAAAGWVYSHAP